MRDDTNERQQREATGHRHRYDSAIRARSATRKYSGASSASWQLEAVPTAGRLASEPRLEAACGIQRGTGRAATRTTAPAPRIGRGYRVELAYDLDTRTRVRLDDGPVIVLRRSYLQRHHGPRTGRPTR